MATFLDAFLALAATSAHQRTTAHPARSGIRCQRGAFGAGFYCDVHRTYTYLADTLENAALVPKAQVGWWLMGFGAVGLFGNWLGGRWVDSRPLGATALFSMLLAIGMAASMDFASDRFWLCLALAIWGVANTALYPVCQIRVMKAASHAKALAGTLNVSAANAGIGLGAIVGGLAFRSGAEQRRLCRGRDCDLCGSICAVDSSACRQAAGLRRMAVQCPLRCLKLRDARCEITRCESTHRVGTESSHGGEAAVQAAPLPTRQSFVSFAPLNGRSNQQSRPDRMSAR